MKKYAFCLIVFILFNSCNWFVDKDSIIYFDNNSNKTIFIQTSFAYPDTTFAANYIFNPFVYDSYGNIIDTANVLGMKYALGFEKDIYFYVHHTTWEAMLDEFDTLTIFLFDGDVIGNTTWETVEKDYLVLQRYYLSWEDLQKLNLKIYYPPTPEMKDMKMYPAYKEGCYAD